MAPFTTEVDWADPAAFYLGDGSLAELADVAIVHRASGLRLPAHSHILAQQSRVMRDLFLSLRGQASGRKRKADEEDDAATQLESPFNDYSLQEVSFVLRFAYRPSDLTDRNLESVLTHLEGITRLANSLDAVVQLAAVDKFLAAKTAQSYTAAVKWIQLAEQCGLDATWAAAVRMVASFIIKEPESGIAAYRQVYRLSSLSCETLTAVLAAVAASVRSIDAAFRSQAGNRIPDAAIVLAGRTRPPSGSASLVWQVPQLAALRERRESPAFGPGGSGDNQGAIAPIFRLAVTGRVPVAAGQEAPIALAAAFQYAQFPIVGGTNTATSLYLVAAFKEECPPGTAAAVRTTVQLLNQSNMRLTTYRSSFTVSKEAPEQGWQYFLRTDALLRGMLGEQTTGTFKVEVEWMGLPAPKPSE